MQAGCPRLARALPLWLAMLGKLRLAQVLLRQGRLAWSLVRDARTPLLAKLILGGALLYAIWPIDLLPDIIPLLGQLDDVAVLALGLELFFRQVPDWLRAEHEAAIGRTRGGGRLVEQPDRRD